MFPTIFIMLSPLMISTSQQEATLPPRIEDVYRALDDLQNAVQSYTVDIEISNRSGIPPYDKNRYIRETAKASFKSDGVGRIYCQSELTKEGERPITIQKRAVFNGEVVKWVDESASQSRGEVSKDRGNLFYWGITPRSFLTHIEHTPAARLLKSLDTRIVGTKVWKGRTVVILQTKINKADGQEFTLFVYLDPKKNFAIVRNATCYRNPPETDWTEYNLMEVSDTIQDASGVWLPTRAILDTYTVSIKRGAPPVLMRHSEITFKNWVINPDIPESAFSLDFQPNTIVKDTTTGQTTKVVKIDDQMLADQAETVRRQQTPKPHEKKRSPLLLVVLSVSILLAMIGLLIWRKRRKGVAVEEEGTP
jgi:outer membrane lipoprotein-sorting protein